MNGSKLVSEVIPAHSGNFTVGRNGKKIQKVTLHHMAAKWTAHRCGELFQSAGRRASSHYGIGYEGEIAQFVSEENTAWADGNWNSNLVSISIECANGQMGSPWPITEKTLESLCVLLADLSLRNGLGIYVKGKNLTWHQMYSATACPGEDLISKLDLIVEKTNALLSEAKNLSEKREETVVNVTASYQVNNGAWLPSVNGFDRNEPVNGYAGVLGTAVKGVRASLSEGDLYYKVHLKGGAWLPEVKNREDYAGVLGKEIDGVMFRSPDVFLSYGVHTKEDGWLPLVSAYDENDAENGYAGILGHTIDALMLKAEKRKTEVQEAPPESEAVSSEKASSPKDEKEKSLWESALPFLTELISLLKKKG